MLKKTKAKLGTYGKRLEYYKRVFPERFGKDPEFFAKLASGLKKVEHNAGGNPNFVRVTDQLEGTVRYNAYKIQLLEKNTMEHL